ncbi:MAG: dihydroorotate dehydrogenase electron transfer subunit [Clostridia bacterium]|nr:dihydroorotate dehydrogenase electron transfer subunit [Clostridia bacterium]
MKKKETAIVVKQEEIADDIYSMWISTSIAETAKPGQFISIYTKNAGKLLPRPISICEINQTENQLRVVYRVAGEGTEEFSGYHSGSKISVLGPLGNGFPLEDKKAFIIGGGIGIPPMLELAKQLDCEKQIIAGYRNELFLTDELKQQGSLYIATEDGSAGVKGTVIQAIKENHLSADIIYACGPKPMLKAIKEYAEEMGIPAYISMEERMACGVGACLGCVCQSKNVDDHSKVNNKRVCKDGPVFLAEEVEL